MLRSDEYYEAQADAARERAYALAAPSLSYEHGLKIGRAIEIALASLEADQIMLTAKEKLILAEGITETCWTPLEDDLNGADIDFREAERGVCAASSRYAAAQREGV